LPKQRGRRRKKRDYSESGGARQAFSQKNFHTPCTRL